MTNRRRETQWRAVDAERSALAGALDGIAVEQWDAQSLCDQWKVRDVVAHLVDSVALAGSDLVRFGWRSLYQFNRVRADAAVARGGQSPEQLLADLRGHLDSHPRRPIPRPIDMLCDTAVHVQDVRRPLGIPYAFPAATAITVADQLARSNLLFGAKRRIGGLRLVADDVTWSRGEGPEVRGPIEAMIMVMADRAVPMSEFHGDGVDLLATRVRPPAPTTQP